MDERKEGVSVIPKYRSTKRAEVALPQAHPLSGQPTIQCALSAWHEAHGYEDIADPRAVPAGSGWCPGVTRRDAALEGAE